MSDDTIPCIAYTVLVTHNQSQFCSMANGIKVLDQRLELMKSRLSNIRHKDFPPNIRDEVRAAIQELANNNSLVIRQADKGSCTVIMDLSQYLSEGYQHLSDPTTYKQCSHDRTKEVAHKANWAIKHHTEVGTLTRYQRGQLLTEVDTVRVQQLYFLRKVHKDPHKIRPIVSASSGPTEKISGHLCKRFAPHLEDVTSLVKNSIQVVQILEALPLSEEPDITLVTFDVESLYPSIPQGPGIEMVLQRVCPTSPPTSRRSNLKNMLREFLKIVLGDNHFQFHNQHYDQIKGVAMGTSCAPQFANLFLASLEERALSSWQGTKPKLWLRFLDDIFMLWKGNQQELKLFHNHLNQQISSINFTMESSQEQAVFLDLQIYKGSRFRENKLLDVSLHVKQTNPQNFLHYSSCHPPATFITIIRGEILRAVRCTSNHLQYTTILDRLLEKFKSRGYPEWLLRQTAENINFQDRRKLLQPAQRRTLEPDTTVFCATYTPAINSSAIKKMLVDPDTPFSPMVLRTRPTSIQDRLVRAKAGHHHN